MNDVSLVTGGCGFIGSHLVVALVSAGRRVRVLDDLSSGRRENLAPATGQVDVVVGDVRDTAVVRQALRGVAEVYHLAALVSVADSIARPLVSHEINARGTLNVLEAARAAGAHRVVLTSSAAVYGNAPALPKREDQLPAPESPYGADKLALETQGRVYARLYGLETVSLRFFNVYGPRQDPSSPYSGVISRFMAFARDRQAPVIYGDGRQTRDFVYVADVVAALMLAMKAPGVGDGSVFNVGTGRPASLLEVLEILDELGGSRAVPIYEPARNGDVRDSLADIGQAERRLGYRPRVSLRDGLQALWQS